MLEIFKRFSTRKSRVIRLAKGKTYHASDIQLVISNAGVWFVPNPKGHGFLKIRPDTVDLVIGAPGLPNMKKELQLGDAVLYQLPNYGVIEIRIIEIGDPLKILISEVSPRQGFAAAYSEDSANESFAKDESSMISQAISKVSAEMSARSDMTPAQLTLLHSKLNEVAEAATRLGRKDWIMFTAGTLTNVVVGAALAPDAARALFTAMNSHLAWIFQNALRLAGS